MFIIETNISNYSVMHSVHSVCSARLCFYSVYRPPVRGGQCRYEEDRGRSVLSSEGGARLNAPSSRIKMRVLWISVPLLAHCALGELFQTYPPPELVVHRGGEVVLECVTNHDVTCAWKLNVPGLQVTGLVVALATSGISENLDIRARDSSGSGTDCTLVISNIDHRHNGRYTCSPYSEIGQSDAPSTDVIIVLRPRNLHFLGPALIILGPAADGLPLKVTTTEPTTLQCKVERARPKAEIAWYLGNTELYDHIEVEYTQEAGLWTSVSTLTYQFRREDLGKRLRCRAIHVGYDREDDQDRERAVEVDVQFAAYRPGGDIVTRYDFTASQQGEVMVNFTATRRRPGSPGRSETT